MNWQPMRFPSPLCAKQVLYGFLLISLALFAPFTALAEEGRKIPMRGEAPYTFEDAPSLQPSGAETDIAPSVSSLKTTFLALYTNEEAGFIEGRSGLQFRKGMNLIAFEGGNITYGEHLAIVYQLKQTAWDKLVKGEVFRAYLKYRFGKTALEIGKDNVALGPGEFGGLLLSSNAEPYPLVKWATEEPLQMLGEWDFTLMNGWMLNDTAIDPKNSQIFALRIAYRPAAWLELGGTRLEHYGGEGRPGYTLPEYWQILVGTNDNISGSKYDNDGFFSIDGTIHLPLNRLWPSVTDTALYFEEAGGDINAFWQNKPAGTPRPFFHPFTGGGTVRH